MAEAVAVSPSGCSNVRFAEDGDLGPGASTTAVTTRNEGQLRVLCFHDFAQSGLVFERQLETALSSDLGMRSWLDLSYLEAPTLLSIIETPVEAQTACVLQGGEPRAWYRYERPGGPLEGWPLFEEAIQFATAHVAETGPWDGLLGFGQGAAVVAELARRAEDGCEALAGQFRFVMSYSSLWQKDRQSRPCAALQVPLLCLFEAEGRYPRSDYEHLAIHWAAAAREVIVHHQGFKPPQLEGQDLSRLRSFLDRFRRCVPHADAQTSTAAAPSACGGGDFTSGCVLPLQARPSHSRSLPTAARVLAICLHDLLPGSCSPRIFDGIAAKIVRPKEFQSRLTLDAPDLCRFASLQDLGREPENAVSERAVAAANLIVDGLVRNDFSGIPVVVVGVGYGAYVGLRVLQDLNGLGEVISFSIDEDDFEGRLVARRPGCGEGPLAGSPAVQLEFEDSRDDRRWVVLDETTMTLRDELGNVDVPYEVVEPCRAFPWRLYAVRPPAVFPTPTPGLLGECGVTVLLSEDDAGGERWRFEAATSGSFDVELVDGSDDAWSDFVVNSLSPAFVSSAARLV